MNRQGNSRIWRHKKQAMRDELYAVATRSPVLKVLGVAERPDELRIRLAFLVPTLVRPRDGRLVTAGPVLCHVRYNESFLRTPPVPWELVRIFAPMDFYHANQRAGGLCIGRPHAGINIEAILHLTYAAITLQSCNTVEWEGLDPEAAGFIRRRAAELPVVSTGLYEHPGKLLRPLETYLPPDFTSAEGDEAC